MLEDLTWLDIVLRAGVASVLGFIIGWDRERAAKAAGLRTMMLVSLGAALFMMLTLQLGQQVIGEGNHEVDPFRVIGGVVGGIGFLGAGCIIQSRGSVQGMTTAATVWVAAGLGLACGLGQFLLAALATGFALVALVGVTALKGTVLPDKDDESGRAGP